jgi:pyruvate kinase
MDIEGDRIERAIAKLDEVLRATEEFEGRYGRQLELVHPQHALGALNLIHYLALRRQDLSALQAELGELGLSQLSRAESNVKASILSVRRALCQMRGRDEEPGHHAASFSEAHAALTRHAVQLFGEGATSSTPAIMVTLPSEAAHDAVLVQNMVSAGMTCARINCTHDDPLAWADMIHHVRSAAAELGRPCSVFMDLGGPQARTGPMVDGPKVIRIKPEKDARGWVTHPVRVEFVADSSTDDIRRRERAEGGVLRYEAARIPVNQDLLAQMQPGFRLRLTDTRKRPCEITIESGACALVSKRLYLETGLELELLDAEGNTVCVGEIADLPPKEQVIYLRVGDLLWMHQAAEPGEPAQWAADGTVEHPAHISCSIPEILERLQVGEPLLIDDGKIRTVVKEKRPDGVLTEVTHARLGGARLRGNKGLNFPETDTGLKGLTEQDLIDLRFVIQHADAVSVSCVNDPDDVEDLCDCLDEMGADHLGVVLKIETKAGYRNLPGILLAAMERPRVAVMIARGDLAAEAGWIELARMQEEMMSLCEAAHVPVVWATQVLERLAKTGHPSRPEISDAALAQRAECVMLNKGWFIIETIRALDSILQVASRYQSKKVRLLDVLHFDDPNPEEVGRSVGTRVGRFGEQR